MSAELFENGIGYVILTRRLKGGDVINTNFLLDVWCLGVKDVILQVLPANVYHEQVSAMEEQFELVDIAPSTARKLVEGAVDFAAQYGLAPHPDYRLAQLAFGDVNAAECPEEFEYGQDGKAFYVAGPNDSLARSRDIANTIKAIDPNSHYAVPIHESMLWEARLPEWNDVMVVDEADDEDDADEEE
jgi:hypothetical protein